MKIAKSKTNDTGIYLLTKYQQDQMSHFLPDTYQPHFFFDVHEYSTPYPQISDQPADDGKVIHYSPFSGY
ncbi:MAG: hypothetical protein MJ200_04340 [Mycoplasmoidaceae bacterium]|nr:hypothetical protein [Mycoplasmoidaceae bacterium]